MQELPLEHPIENIICYLCRLKYKILIKNKRLKPEVEKVELDQFWKGEFSIGKIDLTYWMRKASLSVRGRKTLRLSDWAMLSYAHRRAPGLRWILMNEKKNICWIVMNVISYIDILKIIIIIIIITLQTRRRSPKRTQRVVKHF